MNTHQISSRFSQRSRILFAIVAAATVVVAAFAAPSSAPQQPTTPASIPQKPQIIGTISTLLVPSDWIRIASTLIAAAAIYCGLRGVRRQLWVSTFVSFTHRYAEIFKNAP